MEKMKNSDEDYRKALRKIVLYCRFANRVLTEQPGLGIHVLRMVSFAAARATGRTHIKKAHILADIGAFIARLDARDALAFAVADFYVEETARSRFSKVIHEALHGPLALAEQRIRGIIDGRPVEVAEDEPRGLLRLAARNVVRCETRSRRRAQLRRRLIALDLYPRGSIAAR